jgi:N-dimethylarginine dimethylaminohydrolase
MSFGCHSMVAPLRRVIVKSPKAAFRDPSTIHATWQDFNFLNPPQYDVAIKEHETLVRLLREAGAEVLFLDRDDRTGLDSIYTHDPGIVTDAGAILFQTGKKLRRGEGPAMKDAMSQWDIDILGTLEGEATAEGGDLVWLDRQMLLAGCGFRTNQAGIRSLRELLKPMGVEVIDFDLPYWNGPSDVLHLMSFLSLLDTDLAIVHRPLMPVALYHLLQSRGINMIDVPADEYETLGCNVLALAPRHVLIVEGNPQTRARLEQAGCVVKEFPGQEIAYKGSGGPTCLTRPVLRS